MDTSATQWTYEVHQLSEGYSAIVYDENGRAVADHLREEHARLIVRAVNAHDELVEALTLARKSVAYAHKCVAEELFEPDDSIFEHPLKVIDAALARARGEQP